MIDWYAGKIGYDASGMQLDKMLKITPGGEITWNTDCYTKVQGSFDSSVQMKRTDATEEMTEESVKNDLVCSRNVIQMSGNPVKFMQGHNCFGPGVAELGGILKDFVKALPERTGVEYVDNPCFPSIHRSRVDITVMIDLVQDKVVHDWISNAATSTRTRHQNLPSRFQKNVKGGVTVYWGQKSTRWSMKAYCKHCELMVHPCPDQEVQKKLREYTEGQLRIELCLRRPELKERGTLSEDLVWEFFERIEIGVQKVDINKMDKKELREKMLPAIENTLDMWLAGFDMKVRLPERTFYHYRRIILNEVGVDISLDRHDQEEKVDRVKFDIEYLKENEIKSVPGELKKLLFVPSVKSTAWGA